MRREKERQADRDGLIGTVTRMEENLKTYDRFDSLQGKSEGMQGKRRRALKKAGAGGPWRKGSGRNEMTAMRRYWKAFARQEKNTRQP
ncbi:MAG: hypothetical protein ACLTDI_13500 [Acutalibacteraceae bacterium]